MPHITVNPDPCYIGDFVTICYVPVTGVAYVDVTWYGNAGVPIGGVGLRLTEAQPCVTIKVPDGADHGLVEDEGNQAQDALIKVFHP